MYIVHYVHINCVRLTNLNGFTQRIFMYGVEYIYRLNLYRTQIQIKHIKMSKFGRILFKHVEW